MDIDQIKQLVGDIREAITIIYFDKSITPYETAKRLRNIAGVTISLADRIEKKEGMNESQSRTDIGADSDTRKARCTKMYHDYLYGEGFITCLTCLNPLSS